ncbi:phage tail termination protein [Ewingella americana]
MTPSMQERFKRWIINSGLITGYKLQMYQWRQLTADKGTQRYAIIQPNGGTPVRNDLGSEFYMLLLIVAGQNDIEQPAADAQAIIDFTQDNPFDDCLGYIENMDSTPTPIFTEENRMVLRLQFRIVYGD